MNKSYRSIFNESLSAWVAVSEIEVAHGKSSAGSRIRLRRMPGMRFVMGALIAAMIYGWGGSAQAACIYSVTGGSTNLRIEVIPDTPAELSLCLSSINKTMHYVSINSVSEMGNYYNDGATGVNAIAIGANASASGSAAAALGYGAQATVAGGVALGRNSVADRPAILPAAAYVPAGATAGQTTAIQNTVVGSLGAVSVGSAAGTRQITNVAAGSADTDAVNVAQLKAINATASAGWNLQANGGPVTNIAPNGTVNVVNGSNTTAVLTGNQLQVNVVSNPTFTGTVTAPTFVASGGNPITISGATGTIGGLTNTTFDPLSYTSGQAATEDQLAEVARTANNPLTFAGDSGTPVARKLGETVNIVGGAAGTLTDGNIGVVADGTDTLTVKLAKDINLGATGSVTIGNTLVNTSGLTITGGPSVTTSGIYAGGQRITGVAAGTAASDAVNLSQLQEASAGARTEVAAGTNIASVVKTTGASGQDIYTVNADGASVSAGSTAVTVIAGVKGGNNVTDYAVDLSAATKANIADGASAYATVSTQGLIFTGDSGTTGAKLLGSSVAVTGDSNITTQATASGVQVKLNPDLSVTSVTASTGFYVGATGPSMTTAGIDAGGLVIGNVAAGAVNATSTDAINGSQLYAIQQTASAGWNLQANGGPVTNIAPNGTVNVVNGSNTTAVLTGNQLQVNVVSNPTFTGTVTAPTFVASGGNPITISGATGTIGGLTNTTFDPLSYTSGQAATEDQLAEVARTANNPLTFAGDSGTPVARKLGETVNIVGGAAGTLTDGNIGVVADGTDTLTVKLAKDINLGATGSVTIGNTLVNTSGLTITGGPSVTTSGIDAGEKAITNVADGVNATDAVNVRQLNGAIGSFASRIDTVDRNASAGTASAMAMAGMPQAFTPGKSMFGFGAGTYRGQSAFAMGVSTMTDNGKWVIKGSLSGDSRGNVGGSVGAGFQW